MSDRQHGFRPGRLTSTALKEVGQWVQDNGKHLLCCFLDISGAFDNVRWEQLIKDMKMLQCGESHLLVTISEERPNNE